MPPQKGLVWKHYNEHLDDQDRVIKVTCKYCETTEFCFPNATRMKSHLRSCDRCPGVVKSMFPAKTNDNDGEYKRTT